MKNSFEQMFVRHTSATLKGFKAGSHFAYRPGCEETFQKELQSMNEMLHEKDIRICTTDRRDSSKQVLVYRPSMIDSMLNQTGYRCFLCRLGYPVDEGHKANISHLLAKMKNDEDFPHEMGLFLGYPLDDVLGFIANKGKNYAFCGLWKVYAQPEKAKERFELFQRCREHCLECLRQGQSVLQLIHAA